MLLGRARKLSRRVSLLHRTIINGSVIMKCGLFATSVLKSAHPECTYIIEKRYGRQFGHIQYLVQAR